MNYLAGYEKAKMERNTRISHQYFLIGFGLISLVAYTLIISAISLIRGYPISFWQFPLACVLMLVTQFFASEHLLGKKIMRFFFRTSGILLAIIIVSIFLARLIYDVSFDGQWYHQETVYQLKTGFNPYLKFLPVQASEPVAYSKDVWCSGPDKPVNDSIAALVPTVNLKYLNINHLSKGTEIVEAAIYKFTHRIESGKSVNLIILAGAFCLCLSIMYKINRFSDSKKWLISILACFNPITIFQLFTYCVDGAMASLLLCLLTLFCLFLLEQNKYYLFLLALVIVTTVNIKYTSLVYTGIFCIGFLLIMMVRKEWNLLKKVFYTCTISAILGIGFIGFHPYVTNIISTGQVFYGLQETRNEIYELTPLIFRNKNRFEKLFLSLAARAYDKSADKESIKEIIKVPFTINKKELLSANTVELKMSAFGPFFSGAILISLVVLLLVTFRHSKNPAFIFGMAIIGIILISVFVIPDSWWARFVPQFWLLPVIILLISECLQDPRYKYLRGALYISVGMNVLWAILGILFNIVITIHVNYQLKQLKTLSEPISVEYCAYRSFTSNRVRFMENNIPFVEKKPEGPNIYNVIHSSTRFGTHDELPDLPKPFLMKLNEKLKGDDSN